MSRAIDGDVLTEWISGECKSPSCPKNESTFGMRIIEHIEHMPTIEPEPHWIPFDEQQPEYRQEILVTIHWNESGEEEYFVQYDVYFDDATLNSNFKIGRDAFAWMPIPEPYREESE